MDKETLSNYGWIVICILVMVVMIALATPFGSFVSEAVQSTTQGLFDVNQSALNSTGLINIGDQSFGDGGNGGSGETGTETPSEPEETPTDPEPTECQHTNTTTINASATYTGDTFCNDCKTTIATGETISQYTLSGTWKFNNSFTSFITEDQEINFVSNGLAGLSIRVTSNNGCVRYAVEEGPSGSSPDLSGEYIIGVFYENEYCNADETYKTVDFGTEPQEVSQKFYEWFTTNATQQ